MNTEKLTWYAARSGGIVAWAEARHPIDFPGA